MNYYYIKENTLKTAFIRIFKMKKLNISLFGLKYFYNNNTIIDKSNLTIIWLINHNINKTNLNLNKKIYIVIFI